MTRGFIAAFLSIMLPVHAMAQITQPGGSGGGNVSLTNGKLTYAVSTPDFSAISPMQDSDTKAPSFTFNTSRSISTNAPGQSFDPWIYPGSVMVGGQPRTAQGSSGFADNIGGNVMIRHKPDGFNDLGCVLSVFATPKSIFDTRAPIASGVDTPDGRAAYETSDTATVCNAGADLPPTVIAQDVTFPDAHTVKLSTPLTADQMSRLHPNMYVASNVIDPTIPQHGPSTTRPLDKFNFYSTILKSWSADGMTLTVSGWTVPGTGKTGNSGKIGDVSHLDNRWSLPAYKKPTVFIGAPTQLENENFFMDVFNNDRNSMLHYLTGAEFDFGYNGPSGDVHAVAVDIENAGSGAFDSESAAIRVNGNWPAGIVNQVPCDAIEIHGYNFLSAGCSGGFGNSPGNIWLMGRFQNMTDKFNQGSVTGTDNVAMATFMQRDTDATTAGGGLKSASLHTGLIYDQDDTDLHLTGNYKRGADIAYKGDGTSYICANGDDAHGDYSKCAHFGSASYTLPGLVGTNDIALASATGNINIQNNGAGTITVKNNSGNFAGFESAALYDHGDANVDGWLHAGKYSGSAVSGGLALVGPSGNSTSTITQNTSSLNVNTAYLVLNTPTTSAQGDMFVAKTLQGGNINSNWDVNATHNFNLKTKGTGLFFADNQEYFTVSGDGKTVVLGTQVPGGGNFNAPGQLQATSVSVSGRVQGASASISGQTVTGDMTSTSATVRTSLVIPYGTPPRGSACVNGQIELDANNLYVCNAGHYNAITLSGSRW